MSPRWLLKYAASASQAFKNSSISSGFTVNLLTKTIGPTCSSSCDENLTLSSISMNFAIWCLKLDHVFQLSNAKLTILANGHVRMLGEDLKKHVLTKKDMVKTRV